MSSSAAQSLHTGLGVHEAHICHARQPGIKVRVGTRCCPEGRSRYEDTRASTLLLKARGTDRLESSTAD